MRRSDAMEREEQLVLRLTVEHLFATGEWPELRNLHRRIHQDLHEEADVRAIARRLAPHPFISGYHDLKDTFAPPLRVLGEIEEGAVLLDAVLAFIRHALAKYLSSAGEAQVSEAELVEEFGIDASTSRIIRKLIDGVPFLTNGGGAGQDGWYATVSDDITRWSGVNTREHLLRQLDWIEQERNQEYAALTEAKQRMIEATGKTAVFASPYEASRAEPRTGSVEWFRTRPPVQAILLVGGLAAAIAAVIGLVKALW